MKIVKIEDKSLRVKHMRLLGKFLKSSSSILKLENFDYVLFEKRVSKIYNLIENLDDIRVDSTHFKALQNFIKLTMSTIKNENLEIEEKRNILLKAINLIEKNRNKRVYKKIKHKKIKHDF